MQLGLASNRKWYLGIHLTVPHCSHHEDPADFSVSEQNNGQPLWWADQCENTYRAEDRQGNTLFSVMSVKLMHPLPQITSTQIFDRNGVPMYSHGQLVAGLWNGASISAQVPGEPHLHYLFTIAADGKPDGWLEGPRTDGARSDRSPRQGVAKQGYWIEVSG